MEYTVLGRTGLDVSVAGLGCGGHSRLGLSRGASPDDAVAVVRRALDLGINFIDTAEAYGTEEVVGRGIAGRRDDVVLSTKVTTRRGPARSASDLLDALDASLRRLGTDRVDVWHLHGLPVDAYEGAVEKYVPAMTKARDAGKIRFLGVTEVFAADTGHAMLVRALPDDLFDVIMVGFNVLNQSARERVFPSTMRNGVGTLLMFAVREALTSDEKARAAVGTLRRAFPAVAALDAQRPLAFLGEPLTDSCYRFCRHEPGVDVVLTGTGSVAHLEQNLQAILSPPLDEAVAARARDAFAGVDSVSGN